MNIKKLFQRVGPVLIMPCLLFASTLSMAANDVDLLRQKIDNLERQLNEVHALLDQQAKSVVTHEEIETLKNEVTENKNNFSELNESHSVVHLSGYGNAGYTEPEGGGGGFGMISFNPIFHYQYRDLLMFEGELEFEAGEEGDTELALEYTALNLFLTDYTTLTVGKILSPLGFFRRNLHPGWVNKMPDKPPGFSGGQAAPVADVGIELRGGLPFPLLDESTLNYAIYGANGPVLALNNTGDEIASVETEGFGGDEDGNKLVGGRLGLIPIPGLEIGVSAAYSKVVAWEDEADRDYHFFGIDLNGQWRNFDFKTEYARQRVASLASSVAPGARDWETWYAQLAYKILPTRFEPVIRYTNYNAADRPESQEQWAIGLNYLFSSNVIAKFSYEFNTGANGEATDDNRFLFKVAYGF